MTTNPDHRRRVLLLGASDMEQAIAAARTIEREGEREAGGGEPNVELVRALETAIAVCYWRPFTENRSGIGWLDPVRDGPDEVSGFGDLHRSLHTMRNKVYAHSETGRDAGVREVVTESGVAGAAFSESWWAFPDEWLADVIALATSQRDRFRAEALELRRRGGEG